MLQKIVVGTLVAALSGVLIVGAINRTDAKSEQVAQEQEANSGRLAREEDREPIQQSQGQQGQGNLLLRPSCGPRYGRPRTSVLFSMHQGFQ